MKKIKFIEYNSTDRLIKYLNDEKIPYKMFKPKNSPSIHPLGNYIEIEMGILTDKQLYQIKKIQRNEK